jgi:hypothetical protein
MEQTQRVGATGNTDDYSVSFLEHAVLSNRRSYYVHKSHPTHTHTSILPQIESKAQGVRDLDRAKRVLRKTCRVVEACGDHRGSSKMWSPPRWAE